MKYPENIIAKIIKIGAKTLFFIVFLISLLLPSFTTVSAQVETNAPVAKETITPAPVAVPPTDPVEVSPPVPKDPSPSLITYIGNKVGDILDTIVRVFTPAPPVFIPAPPQAQPVPVAVPPPAPVVAPVPSTPPTVVQPKASVAPAVAPAPVVVPAVAPVVTPAWRFDPITGWTTDPIPSPVPQTVVQPKASVAPVVAPVPSTAPVVLPVATPAPSIFCVTLGWISAAFCPAAPAVAPVPSTPPTVVQPKASVAPAVVPVVVPVVAPAPTIPLITPSISWSAPSSITYGTGLSATQLNATANVTGTMTYNYSSGTVLGAGTQTLTATFTPNASNLTSSSAITKSVTLTVDKKNLNVSADNKTKVEGSVNPTFTASYSGFVNGDTSSVVTGSPTFTTTATTNSTPGTYDITPSAGTLSTPNYTFDPGGVAYNKGTLTIATKLTLTATLSGPNTAVVNTDVTFTPSIGGTQGGNIYYNEYSCGVEGTFRTSNYNTGAFTCKYSTTGTKTASMQVLRGNLTSNPSTTITISAPVAKITPVITWNNPPSITYGTPLGPNQLNATSNVVGTFTYSPASGILNTGTQTLWVNFTPSSSVVNLTSYYSIWKNVSLTVTPPPITDPLITWLPPSSSTKYGEVIGDKEYNVTASVPGTFTYSPAKGTTLPKSGSNTFSVTFVPTDKTRYNTVSQTKNISGMKVPLIVTADNKTKVEGSVNPPLTASYSGFVNGDSASSIGLTPALSTSAVTSSQAGTYIISTLAPSTSPSPGASHYAISFESGTLTIIAKTAPVITWGAFTIIEGSPITNATSNVPGKFTYSTESYNAGTRNITANFTPTDTVNYSSASKTVSMVVNPRMYTLTVAKTGNGNIVSSPTGINYGNNSNASFVAGTPVILTATPLEDSVFTTWTGCVNLIGNTCKVTVNSDINNISATFSLIPPDYELVATRQLKTSTTVPGIINLTWNIIPTATGGYKVYRETGGNEILWTTISQPSSGKIVTTQNTGLAPGALYGYRVVAQTPSGSLQSSLTYWQFASEQDLSQAVTPAEVLRKTKVTSSMSITEHLIYYTANKNNPVDCKVNTTDLLCVQTSLVVTSPANNASFTPGSPLTLAGDFAVGNWGRVGQVAIKVTYPGFSGIDSTITGKMAPPEGSPKWWSKDGYAANWLAGGSIPFSIPLSAPSSAGIYTVSVEVYWAANNGVGIVSIKGQQTINVSSEPVIPPPALSCAAGETELLKKTTSGLSTWTVPNDVSLVNLKVWGAGGSGGVGLSQNGTQESGAGGGGGGYAEAELSVTPGTAYEILVGKGGKIAYVDMPKAGAIRETISAGSSEFKVRVNGKLIYTVGSGGGGNAGSHGGVAYGGGESGKGYDGAVSGFGAGSGGWGIGQGPTHADDEYRASHSGGSGGSGYSFGPVSIVSKVGDTGSSVTGGLLHYAPGSGGKGANGGGGGVAGAIGKDGVSPGGGGGGSSNSVSVTGNGADGAVLICGKKSGEVPKAVLQNTLILTCSDPVGEDMCLTGKTYSLIGTVANSGTKIIDSITSKYEYSTNNGSSWISDGMPSVGIITKLLNGKAQAVTSPSGLKIGPVTGSKYIFRLNSDGKETAVNSNTVTLTPASTLNITIAGTGSGTVSDDGGAVKTCTSGSCSQVFTSRVVTNLKAVAGSNSTFTGWSGVCSDSAKTCGVDMANVQNVTATFTACAAGGCPPPTTSENGSITVNHQLSPPSTKPADITALNNAKCRLQKPSSAKQVVTCGTAQSNLSGNHTVSVDSSIDGYSSVTWTRTIAGNTIAGTGDTASYNVSNENVVFTFTYTADPYVTLKVNGGRYNNGDKLADSRADEIPMARVRKGEPFKLIAGPLPIPGFDRCDGGMVNNPRADGIWNKRFSGQELSDVFNAGKSIVQDTSLATYSIGCFAGNDNPVSTFIKVQAIDPSINEF